MLNNVIICRTFILLHHNNYTKSLSQLSLWPMPFNHFVMCEACLLCHCHTSTQPLHDCVLSLWRWLMSSSTKLFFRLPTILQQESRPDCLLDRSRTMISSCIALPFFVSPTLEHHHRHDCLFRTWYWILSSSTKLQFYVTPTNDNNLFQNNLFDLSYCLTGSNQVQSLLINQILPQTLFNIHSRIHHLHWYPQLHSFCCLASPNWNKTIIPIIFFTYPPAKYHHMQGFSSSKPWYLNTTIFKTMSSLPELQPYPHSWAWSFLPQKYLNTSLIPIVSFFHDTEWYHDFVRFRSLPLQYLHTTIMTTVSFLHGIE